MKKILFIVSLLYSLQASAWSYFSVGYANNTSYPIYFNNDVPGDYNWDNVGNLRGSGYLPAFSGAFIYTGIADNVSAFSLNDYKGFSFNIPIIYDGVHYGNYAWVYVALNNPKVGAPKIYWGTDANGQTLTHYTEISDGLYYDKNAGTYTTLISFHQTSGCTTKTGMCPIVVKISEGTADKYEKLYTWAIPFYKNQDVNQTKKVYPKHLQSSSAASKLHKQAQTPW